MRAVYNYRDAAPLKLHRVAYNTYELQNMWPGLSSNSWVAYRNSDMCFRSVYGRGDAVQLKFVETGNGIEMYNVTNKSGWTGLGMWIGFSTSGRWLYSRYNTQGDAMPVKFHRPSIHRPSPGDTPPNSPRRMSDRERRWAYQPISGGRRSSCK